MVEQILSQLEYTNRTLKRAQYEAFQFSLINEKICVRNESHAEPEQHEYLVTVEDGIPISCECPADAHYDGACKHRIAVAIRAPVLKASTHVQAIADGSLVIEHTDENDDDEAVACDCIEHPGKYPCWECVESGRVEYPAIHSRGTE